MKFEVISFEEAKDIFSKNDVLSHATDDQIRKSLESVILPKRSTKYSAGYDFRVPSFYGLPIFEVRFHQKIRIPLLVKAVDMPRNVALLIYNRSGLSLNQGLTLDNGVGVVDCDYERCIFFQATNNNENEDTILITPSMKICQGIFTSFLTVDEEEEIAQTREGGLGHTG